MAVRVQEWSRDTLELRVDETFELVSGASGFLEVWGWFPGVQGFWFPGVQGFWFPGVQGFWRSGVSAAQGVEDE